MPFYVKPIYEMYMKRISEGGSYKLPGEAKCCGSMDKCWKNNYDRAYCVNCKEFEECKND